MTTERRSGAVFDIGYQRYTGVRQGRSRGRAAIYTDGVRAALGLGRGSRAKVLPWLFIALLSGIATIMALVAGAMDSMGGPGTAAQRNLPSHGDFYGIASVVMFVFAAVVGPELLCRDRREGVIHLYLVRPLTGSDYVAARWFAFFSVMVAAAWLPQTILFAGLSMGAPDPVLYLGAHWLDVPRYLLSGLVLAAFITTLSMLTASFTTRRAYASVFLVGLFIITTPLTAGLSRQIDGLAGQWISMFTLANIPVHVNDVIFGEVSDLTRGAPAGQFPAWALVGWYFAWTVIPATILWFRYHRMSA